MESGLSLGAVLLACLAGASTGQTATIVDPTLDEVVVTGRVIDEAGTPLAGATVTYVPRGAALVALGLAAPGDGTPRSSSARRAIDLRIDPKLLPRATTRADGRFELHAWTLLGGGDREESVDVGGWIDLLVVLTEEGALEIRYVAAPEAEIVLGDVPIGPVQAIVGRVVGSDGRPIRGARVTTGDRRLVDLTGLTAAVTDDQGLFRLREAGWGERQITVRAPGCAPWTGSVESEGVTDVCDITLDCGGVVEGVVTDQAGGPIPGAEVIATRSDFPDEWWSYDVFNTFQAGEDTIRSELTLARQRPLLPPVRSDVEGHFRIAGIPVEGVRLYTSAPFHEPDRTDDVMPGEHDMRVALETEARATVQVVDGVTGQPVPVTMLSAVRLAASDVERWRPPLPNRLEVLAGAEAAARDARFEPGVGRFLLCGVGHDFTLVEVEAPSHAPESAVKGGVAPGAHELWTIALPSTARFEVRVSDVDGKPVTGAVLKMRFVTNDRFDLTPWVDRVASVDQDGRFAMACGENRPLLQVEAPGYGTSASLRVSHRTRAEVDVVLEPEAWVAGVLRGEEGRPLVGHEVKLSRKDSDTFTMHHPVCVTNGDGRFAFRGVGRGRHLLSTPDVEVLELDVLPGAQLEVEYPTQAARITGRVTHGGEPVDDARVIAKLVASSTGRRIAFRGSTHTDEDGRYSVDLYYQGRFRVEVQADGLVVEREVETAHGRVEVMDFELEM